MTPENGSTEIWLGTHTRDVTSQEGAHGERASGRIKKDILEQRQQTHGPCQPTIKQGSIVIRDLRLWHAGMPNTTQDIRIMLAMIHFAPWYRNRMRLEFGEDLRPLLEETDLGLEIPVDFMPRDDVLERYLNRAFGNAYDFDQEP